ncbi:hypothetical protein SEA_AEGEUS_78 [Mycobacterium phage Aegeus]|nr:hypothetical protein SEA_BAUDELAIRE_78 [Mycobacterium phage Baudelaire]WKW86570.1 hypothetical protein SEA_AEGEUS_78 [Mycobacterium phage Aegeus]
MICPRCERYAYRMYGDICDQCDDEDYYESLSHYDDDEEYSRD